MISSRVIGNLIQNQVTNQNNQQNDYRKHRSVLRICIGLQFIQQYADGLSITAVQEQGHSQLVEGRHENQEPAGNYRRCNKRHDDILAATQPASAGIQCSLLQRDVHLAQRSGDGTHRHRHVFYQISNYHNPHRGIQVQAKITAEGNNQSQRNNDGRGTATDNYQQIRQAAAFDSGFNRKICNKNRNKCADAGSNNSVNNGIPNTFHILGAGDNRNTGIKAQVVQTNRLGQSDNQAGKHDGAQRNDNGNHAVSANQAEAGPFPFAQLNDVRTGALTADSGVILFANHPGHTEQQDVSKEHQGSSQSSSITYARSIAHVNISYDTRGHYFNVARHTYDSRNTEAAAGSNKYQQAACQNGRSHQRQGYVKNGTHRRSAADTRSLLQGRIHFLHSTGNGDESKGRVEQSQYPA